MAMEYELRFAKFDDGVDEEKFYALVPTLSDSAEAIDKAFQDLVDVKVQIIDSDKKLSILKIIPGEFELRPHETSYEMYTKGTTEIGVKITVKFPKGVNTYTVSVLEFAIERSAEDVKSMLSEGGQ